MPARRTPSVRRGRGRAPEHAVVFAASVISALSSGLAFGWPSLSALLKTEGHYSCGASANVSAPADARPGPAALLGSAQHQHGGRSAANVTVSGAGLAPVGGGGGGGGGDAGVGSAAGCKEQEARFDIIFQAGFFGGVGLRLAFAVLATAMLAALSAS